MDREIIEKQTKQLTPKRPTYLEYFNLPDDVKQHQYDDNYQKYYREKMDVYQKYYKDMNEINYETQEERIVKKFP